MPDPTHPSDTSGTHDLDAALDRLERVLGPEPLTSALILGLTDLDPTAPEPGVVSWLPDGLHPAEALLGLVAPAPWSAVGVVAEGRARRLDDDAEEAPSPVRLALLVDRDGRVTSRLSGDWAGDPAPSGGEGRLVDLCRRALGAPTDPPATPVVHWWATHWLTELRDRVAAAPDERWDPGPVAACHPATTIGGERPYLVVAGAPALIGLARRRAGELGWSGVRSMATRCDDARIAELATWFDDGSFGRWVVGNSAEPRDVRTDLESLLAEPSLRLIDDCLAAWGLAEDRGSGAAAGAPDR